MHVHDDHSSDGSLPRQASDDRLPGNMSITDQIGIAQLRALNFLPLTDHRTYDQHYDPLWRSDSLLLIPGEEANGAPHATVHGAVDTVVQGAEVAGAPARRSLQQSIWDAHLQDAVWITAHPDDGEVDEQGQPNDFADAVGIDAVEVWNKASNAEIEIDYAENRWNAGFRFGVAGASDNHFKELWLLAGPGQPRSGVLAAALTERAIVAGLRAGRSRVRADERGASGTMTLSADGIAAQPGDEVVASVGTALTLQYDVSGNPGDVVRVFRSPGRSQGAVSTQTIGFSGQLQMSLPVSVESQPTWYRLEVRGLGAPQTVDYAALADDPLGFVLGGALSLTGQLRLMVSPIFVSSGPVEPQLATPLPADTGVDDSAVAALGSIGQFSGFADIAVSDQNKLHVVAEAHDAGRSRVLYRRADDAAAAAVVLSGDSVAARFPRVAALGDIVYVVWQDSDGREIPQRPRILMRQSLDGGRQWQAVQTIAEPDGRAEHPAIAVDRQGRVMVAWQQITPDQPFDIYAQLLGVDTAPINLSGEGKSIAAANPLDTRSARYPASVWPNVAVAADGRFAIAWQDNRDDPDPLWTGQSGSGEGTNPDDWQIRLRQRAAGATDWSALITLGAADRADRHPDVAYDPAGKLVAVWDSKVLSAAGVNLAVLSSESLDGVTGWSEPIAITDEGLGSSQNPRIGTGLDGRLRVAWADSRSADWRWRIGTVRQSVDAGWSGAELLLSKGNNGWPALDGGVLVFASTRNAMRLQRDPTQQIMALTLEAGR